MKKKTVFLMIIAVFVVVCLYNLCYDDKNEIEKRYGIDLSGAKIISDADTHGGFFGDGDRFTSFDVSSWKTLKEETAHWENLPLTENLEIIMYGGEIDGTIYGYDLAKKGNIPHIEDGKYYFTDRQHELNTDTDLFSGASFNFTLFMLDEKENILYMVEFDT